MSFFFSQANTCQRQCCNLICSWFFLNRKSHSKTFPLPDFHSLTWNSSQINTRKVLSQGACFFKLEGAIEKFKSDRKCIHVVLAEISITYALLKLKNTSGLYLGDQHAIWEEHICLVTNNKQIYVAIMFAVRSEQLFTGALLISLFDIVLCIHYRMYPSYAAVCS